MHLGSIGRSTISQARCGRRSRDVRLLLELKSAGATDDAEAFISKTGSISLFEIGLDVPGIFLTLMGEHSSGIFPRVDDAVAGELCAAVLGDLARKYEGAGLSLGPARCAKIAVGYNAVKIPGETLSASLRRADNLRTPIAVEAFRSDEHSW